MNRTSFSRTAPTVEGWVAPGFEAVRHAFAKNLTHRNERGAACAAYHEGECVVDLWGGVQDVEGAVPWQEDTLVLVFSATKGVAAAALAVVQSREGFSHEMPVAEVWPAFGQHDKREITIGDLLAHRAGLAAVDATLTPERIADRPGLMKTLAAKAPDWAPGTRHGYHAWSLGWYEDELLRRLDPNGRTLSAFVQDEIVKPLDLEFYVGLPEDVPEDRVAEIASFSMIEMLTSIGQFPARMLLSLANPWSLSSRALNPFPISSPAELNDPAYRRLSIPSGTGIGTVRSLAQVYGDLAIGGPRLGLSSDVFERLTTPAPSETDVILKTETAYRAGFSKPSPAFPFGSATAFGAPGAGGAFGFADPAQKLGFAYAPNRMGTHLRDDPREVALRDAVRRCL